MLLVQLSRELNGLLSELHGWRVLGEAVKRYCADHPGADVDLEALRKTVEAEAAAAKPATEAARKRRPRRRR